MRHRVSLQDLGILSIVMLAMTYFAFEVDIFTSEGNVTPREQTIELDESLLLGAALISGLLIFAVRRYYGQKREMGRRIEAEQRVRLLAYQDPLTGLANRRQFDEALSVAVASLPKGGASHAVFLLDLNGFKQINDTYGHGVGDDVLVVVAQRLQAAVREGDLVARLGGDEFIVLARHMLGGEAATSLALRIMQSLQEPLFTGGVRHQVGAGIGIALVPDDADTVAEAIRKADVALYRAKAERRPAFRFFEMDMDRLVHEREAIENALRHAIDKDLIVPRFRPSLDLRTGQVTGFEAVPSWSSPDGSNIDLNRLLAVAEETGLIHALANRVFEHACAAATTWPVHISLSIDIFPGQLKDRELWRTMLQIAENAGLCASRLEIEITESMIVQDLDAAKIALGPLRDAGAKISVDNFGTGYSNLYHMQEFKLDKVKIDRRFVENIGEEETSRVIKALAGLGHGLGLTVSAEGDGGEAETQSLAGSGIEQTQRFGELVTADEAFGMFRRLSA